MRTFRDAKVMAKALREELARRKVSLTHSDCLEIVARQFGLGDWNILSVRLAPSTLLPSPTGWLFTGSKPDNYAFGVDPQMQRGAGYAAVIRWRDAEDDRKARQSESGFGTLMQSVSAVPYRGRRVRLEAELRTEAIEGAGTIWLRIERERGRILAFDNMEQRAADGSLVGTQNWTRRRIVLDVPEEAESLHFGFYLRGKGRVWAAGFALAEADPADMLTGGKHLPDEPVNMTFSDFDKSAA